MAWWGGEFAPDPVLEDAPYRWADSPADKRFAGDLVGLVHAVAAACDEPAYFFHWYEANRAHLLLKVQTLDDLAHRLAHGDAASRYQTAWDLCSLGTQALPATGHLISALHHDPESEVRESAAGALASVGAPAGEAVPALVLAMTDSSPRVRARVLEVLPRWMPDLLPEVSPAIRSALQDPDGQVRARAADALARLGPEADAVPALVRCLTDADRAVRSAAATALGRIGPAAAPAVTPLTAILREWTPDHRLKVAAGHALGEIGPAAAASVPDLIVAARDERAVIRAVAVSALGRIGHGANDVIPVLIDRLKDT